MKHLVLLALVAITYVLPAAAELPIAGSDDSQPVIASAANVDIAALADPRWRVDCTRGVERQRVESRWAPTLQTWVFLRSVSSESLRTGRYLGHAIQNRPQLSCNAEDLCIFYSRDDSNAYPMSAEHGGSVAEDLLLAGFSCRGIIGVTDAALEEAKQNAEENVRKGLLTKSAAY